MEQEQIKSHVANFEKLLSGEKIDVYENGISFFFEYACGSLFKDLRDRDIWYDGITEPSIRKRKTKQLEFTGKIWLAKGGNEQWLEPFRALVTDKRATKQGIWLSVDVGEYHAEGDICSL
ncbi:hypothetical protein NBRC116493_03910 [Aurantivibrio infirmus]